MADFLRLGKYSLGMGDRFAHQARPQLQACVMAANQGTEVIPVWNKSNREHLTIGSDPGSTRAVAEAARIYRHIAGKKGEANFITEVSMDETDQPQTPPELLVILAALADERVPLQTIAPKFTGRFNKGVDYVGDLAQFEKEFNEDLAVIAFAIKQYGLPASLKLSVHSGSDKFSIYAPMRRALARFGSGLHLKTAGTTWLEEVIGLAEAGGNGLAVAKDIYADALAHGDGLCAPYAAVIGIDAKKLPPK